MYRRLMLAAAVTLTALPLAAQVTPDVTGPVSSLGILGTAQAETLSYKQRVSAGFKVLANSQWHDWLGVEARGTAITFVGSNHTFAFEAGPRFTRNYGPVTAYAEALAGAIHQYYYGATIGALVGEEIHISRGVYWATDGEYRYAPQKSTATINPREGRIELSSGIVVRIGK